MLSPPGHNSEKGEKPQMKMQSNLAHHQQSSYTSTTLTLITNRLLTDFTNFADFDPALTKQVIWEYRHAQRCLSK